MSGSANVRSIDVVPVMARALHVFGEEAATALTDLNLEVNRAIQWFSHDMKEYWTQQVRKAQEQVAEARINVERKQLFRIAEERPSCVEEKKALEAAKRRLQLSQQKLEAVRRWTQVLARDFMEYKGRVAVLASWLQTDLPKGLAVLKRMAGALEKYVDLEMAAEAAAAQRTSALPPQAGGAPAGASPAAQASTAVQESPAAGESPRPVPAGGEGVDPVEEPRSCADGT
jgi:exonuclease VII large subunit